MELLVLVVIAAVIFVLGYVEKKKHDKNVNAIPVRVNVNGIRGKSTVTRLITAMLREAGFITVGKTTGTSARMLYNDGTELPIERRPEGPNIGEQRIVVKDAAEHGAEALVCECMAVNPDYQITFQEQLLQANIGVIVNVLEDHMDVMGPTLDEVAQAFTATIPHHGTLVTIDGEYVDLFKKVAKERNTRVIVVDPSVVEEDYLQQFDFMIFPDNVALALGVAEALDIPEEQALKGMLKTEPDPGAMRIKKYYGNDSYGYFVNGFAANDPTSTVRIWERVQEQGYPTADPLVIMNCRADRVDRTFQFADDVLPHIETGSLLVIGEMTEPIMQAYQSGKFQAKKIIDLENAPTEKIIATIEDELDEQVIYGIGNIHGAGEPLIAELVK